MKKANRSVRIIEQIFMNKYKEGDHRVEFERTDITLTAERLGVKPPKNLGDVIYSFKYRNPLPESVIEKAPAGREWIIKNEGTAKYAFVAVTNAWITPDHQRTVTKIPEATPGIISKYALGDEQALLARLRYNRLLDIFTGVTCYSLQNHLRTTVPGIGQVETDEIYVGIDKQGRQYVFPVQAKGGKDNLSVVQIEQDIRLCEDKFPDLICRAIATQFLENEKIVIFEFILQDDEVRKTSEKHYRLVPSAEISKEDLQSYQINTD